MTGDWTPGWYLLEGSGFSAGVRMRLVLGSSSDGLPVCPANAAGHLKSLLILRRPVPTLTLEAVDGRPINGSARLRRLATTDAVVRMAIGLHSNSRVRLGALVRDALGAAGIGLRRVPEVVVARYFAGLEHVAKPTVGAKLGRMFWPFRLAAQLKPVRQVSALDNGEWEATGDDPAYVVAYKDTTWTIAPGWYRLRVTIPASAGRITGPALYPDYGSGYAHDELISLGEPDRDGRIDTVVMFKHEVRSLRFDPTTRRGRFRVERFELIRYGRLSALVAMLSALRGGPGRWPEVVRGATAFVRSAASSGLSRAASLLYERQVGRSARGGTYQDWVLRYDCFQKPDVQWLVQRASKLAREPLISILLPVYNTPERWLRRCIDGVLRQAYAHWELCIADDASTVPHVRRVLKEYARRDSRIRFTERSSNGHISEASNSALALATGEFVGLLDHDDELRPHALLEMAEAIAADPDVALLYSDEDKIDAEGRRFNPYFKPDWNPDLLVSQNYVCHFTVIRTELVREVGGFRTGFEGSQDHDLVLRCTERLAPARIRHIPKILYHWRAIEGSTALVREAKDYASVAGLRAVSEHLERRGCDAIAEELPHGHFRVRWRVPLPAPRVSILIPTRDRVELLRTCIESLRARTTYPDYEIVVVDNQSADPKALAYLDQLRGQEHCRVLHYDAPFNYAAINNWAVAQCDSPLLCLLNNDIEVTSPGWLEEMAGHALRADVGAVGAMLLYPDRTIQHAGVILGIGGVANHAYVGLPAGYPGHGGRALVAQNLSAVTGACLVVRRSVYQEVGGLDEQLRVAFNDIDFCLRLRQAGYRNVWTPFAELCHHESASRGRDDTDEKQQRFASEVALMQQRWGDLLHHDPAYNPNLTLDGTGFQPAFPPRA